jgi:hypothetical protein
MASQSNLFHPLTQIKAQAAKQFRLRQQFLNVSPPLTRAALNRFSVTSGASNADASRSRANTNGDTRKSGDGNTRNTDTDDSTHSGGMAGIHNSGGPSKAGADNRSASRPWRRLWIVHQRR